MSPQPRQFSAVMATSASALPTLLSSFLPNATEFLRCSRWTIGTSKPCEDPEVGVFGFAPQPESLITDRSISVRLRRDFRTTHRGRGTIINIASVVGVATGSLNGVYGATKAFVIAFTDSLQRDLAGKGICIQAVLPGATATDIWSGLPLQHVPPSVVMSPENQNDAR